jgi:MerR family mercuric resistance operon transcriptional regulator
VIAMPGSETFQIGILSQQSAVNIETIRYYERIGLVPKPPRSGSGYRRYGAADVERLNFIRRVRYLGFSLEEVRRLLELADQKSRSCRRVHEIAVGHLAEVRAKMADLSRMEKVLAGIVKECAQGTMPECPLLATLACDTERNVCS